MVDRVHHVGFYVGLVAGAHAALRQGETQMTDTAPACHRPGIRPTRTVCSRLPSTSRVGLMIFDDNEELVFMPTSDTWKSMDLAPSRSGREPRSRSSSSIGEFGIQGSFEGPTSKTRELIGSGVVRARPYRSSPDGGSLHFTIYPMPGGGGMATHEDITAREQMSARLKRQLEVGKEQEEKTAGAAPAIRYRRSKTCRRALLL